MPRTPTLPLNYIRTLYAVQDALLNEIDACLRTRNMAIHVGAEEGKLLQLLVALHKPMRIVEVGTLAGYSALWMARALPRGGQLYTIDKDQEHVRLARDFFARSEVGDRIISLEGDAKQVLQRLNDKGPFDMVFIDADKNSYNDYLDWAEAHVRKGGLIVADNTLLFGSVYLESPPEGIAPGTWRGMRRFNERLADTQRYMSVMVPTEEGLTVAVKL